MKKVFSGKTNDGKFLQTVALADEDSNLVNVTDGGLDVMLQDLYKDAIIIPFNKVTNNTTLDTLAVLENYTISVTSATGISIGSFIALFNPISERFSTFYVIGVSGTDITLDTPIDFAYPVGTYVDVAITNLAVDGSSVAQVFGLRGTGAPPGVDLTMDVTRLMFECTATSAVDLNKFANLATLTKGLVLRSRNGHYKNIFNVKNNAEIAGIMYDLTVTASTNPQQGVDGFVGRLTFAGQNKMGVAIRLPIGEDLEIIIQDDLLTAQGGETITNFKIIAEGHLV